MTSTRKVRTNRANARASSGPKTSAGRVRSARNALRHGLNVPIADLEVFSPEVERLADAISGTQPGDAQLERHVRLVAEAQIDMLRARQARDRFMADKLGQRDYQKRSTVRLKTELLRRNLLGRMTGVPLFQGLITAWASSRKARKSSRLFYSRNQASLPCSIGMRTGLGDVAIEPFALWMRRVC